MFWSKNIFGLRMSICSFCVNCYGLQHQMRHEQLGRTWTGGTQVVLNDDKVQTTNMDAYSLILDEFRKKNHSYWCSYNRDIGPVILGELKKKKMWHHDKRTNKRRMMNKQRMNKRMIKEQTNEERTSARLHTQLRRGCSVVAILLWKQNERTIKGWI